MNKEKLEKLAKELQQEGMVIAHCCCGSKKTISTHC